MAARNFWLRNANRYFVATMPDDCGCDDFWFDDEVNYLGETAESVGFAPCHSKEWKKDIERRANSTMRDYYASVIPFNYEADYTDDYDWTWRVELIPLLRSGYYEGGVLDYYIRLCSPDGDQAEDEELTFRTISEMVKNFIDYRAAYDEQIPPEHGVSLIMQSQALIKQAEDKFYEFAEASGLEEYILGGTFSNGEGVYINKSELEKRALKKEAV